MNKFQQESGTIESCWKDCLYLGESKLKILVSIGRNCPVMSGSGKLIRLSTTSLLLTSISLHEAVRLYF